MDIRQLEIFLSVMDASSVTGAAMRMNLSPGAVSLQLQNLAQRRLHAGCLSAQGKASEADSGGARAWRKWRAIWLRSRRPSNMNSMPTRSDDIRPFHLATGATTLIYRLGQPLRQLRQRFPKAKLHITVSATEEMITGLLQRRFDLALITLPVEPSALRIIPLYEEELLVLRPASKSVRGWHVGTIQPQELRGRSFVLHSKRSNMRTLIDGMFQEIGFRAADRARGGR